MPPDVWKSIDSVSGRGELVFPDGSRIPVSCRLEVLRLFTDGDVPISSRIEGVVWDPNDEFMPMRLLGRLCTLELKGRRLSMFVSDAQGRIAHSAGVVEGFPDLKG